MSQILQQRCPTCDEQLRMLYWHGETIIQPRRISKCRGYKPGDFGTVCHGISGESDTEALITFEKTARSKSRRRK